MHDLKIEEPLPLLHSREGRACERKRRTRERVYEREAEGGGWGERSMRPRSSLWSLIKFEFACLRPRKRAVNR